MCFPCPQLRVQELAKALDAALPPKGSSLVLLSGKEPPAIDANTAGVPPPPPGLETVSARALVAVLRRCFAPDVVLRYKCIYVYVYVYMCVCVCLCVCLYIYIHIYI